MGRTNPRFWAHSHCRRAVCSKILRIQQIATAFNMRPATGSIPITYKQQISTEFNKAVRATGIRIFFTSQFKSAVESQFHKQDKVRVNDLDAHVGIRIVQMNL